MGIMYRIKEIFKSIQGEGINAGRIATFVRFAGCNKKCEWCDTDHSGGTGYELQELIAAILKASGEDALVVLTGGEPMLQLECELLRGLTLAEKIIAIETNGTKYISKQQDCFLDWITCSPKAPGECVLSVCSELKIVNDGSFSIEQLKDLAQKCKAMHYLIQPCQWQGGINYKASLELVLKLGDPWRLTCQMHKIIGCK